MRDADIHPGDLLWTRCSGRLVQVEVIYASRHPDTHRLCYTLKRTDTGRTLPKPRHSQGLRPRNELL